MNRCLLAVILMSLMAGLHAEIYKWTDSQGNVHFSDTPKAGAQKVDIPETQTYSPPSSQTPSNGESPLEEKPQNQTDHQYVRLGIIQPENQATVRNNQGYVVIAAQLEPELMPGDQFQLLFDGTPMGDPQTNPVFQINGIYRGSHTIAVEVLDEQGNVLITSPEITVHIQRPRILQQNKK